MCLDANKSGGGGGLLLLLLLLLLRRERERESERRRRVGGVLGVDALALVEKDDGTDSDTTTL